MNKKISISILFLVIVFAGILIYKIQKLKHTELGQSTIEVKDVLISEGEPVSVIPKSFDYLFEVNQETRNTLSGNAHIVGYLAHGAFAWYVPEWIENWKIKEIEGDPDNQGMILTPREYIENSPISDITIYIATSTERFNAETLFENQKDAGVVMSEVLLSQHVEGGITIVTESNTRIYHVQVRDRDKMTDIYYLNGNNKTASISFSSDRENFLKYSAKIRGLVEGMGELREPQG